MLKKISSLIFFIFIITSCVKEEEKQLFEFWKLYTPFKVAYNTFSMPYTEEYSFQPESLGKVHLSEASGIGYSRTNHQKIWAHNDSGHPNILFLLNATNGEIMARYIIQGSANIDWEDMEITSDKFSGQSLIYIADTGDNHQKRPDYSIYIFPEPHYDTSHYNLTITINELQVNRIRFVYPDGSHDTEAMFVDPNTMDIYLATKRDVTSFLYVLPYPQATEGEGYAKCFKVGELGFREASAGNVSFDGKKVIIKNRQDIFYWVNRHDLPFYELLATTPVRLPYIGEPQGEAICFDSRENYFTLSEQTNQLVKPILYKYNLKN